MGILYLYALAKTEQKESVTRIPVFFSYAEMSMAEPISRLHLRCVTAFNHTHLQPITHTQASQRKEDMKEVSGNLTFF